MIIISLIAVGHNRQALLHWLMPKSDEKHAKALKLWTQGTGNWLVQHPDFICWAEGDDSLLWLNGIRESRLAICIVHSDKPSQSQLVQARRF